MSTIKDRTNPLRPMLTIKDRIRHISVQIAHLEDRITRGSIKYRPWCELLKKQRSYIEEAMLYQQTREENKH